VREFDWQALQSSSITALLKDSQYQHFSTRPEMPIQILRPELCSIGATLPWGVLPCERIVELGCGLVYADVITISEIAMTDAVTRPHAHKK
jgi:hypothetical protein